MNIETQPEETEIKDLSDLRWYLEACIAFWQYETYNKDNELTPYERVVAAKYEEALQAVYKTCFGRYFNEEA